MYSDPMPGENFENAAEREKARAEREAIANGENFNPNLSAEAAAGFESLGDDVPFAGDAIQPTDEKHDSDNAIGQEFDEQWDQGKTPDLDDIQESVERDYIDGAIEQSATNPDAAADLADAERNAGDHPDGEQPDGDQPHGIAEAAATQAISAASLSEELAEDIKAGDEDAIARIDEVTRRAAEAENAADKIAYAAANNANGDIETRMATDVAAQAQEKAMEAIETVETAKSEFDSMSEEEKTKIEEEEEDVFKPDLSRGIFG